MPADGTEDLVWDTLMQTNAYVTTRRHRPFDSGAHTALCHPVRACRLADTTQAKLNYAYANRVAVAFHVDVQVRWQRATPAVAQRHASD